MLQNRSFTQLRHWGGVGFISVLRHKLNLHPQAEAILVTVLGFALPVLSHAVSLPCGRDGPQKAALCA